MATACNEFEQDLVLYHYGELSGDSRDQLASHLRACPACASYLKELAALLPLTVNTDEPGQEFWQNYSREMRHKVADGPPPLDTAGSGGNRGHRLGRHLKYLQ